MSKKNRKRKLEGEEQTMVDWEQENIFPDDVRNEMETMWEIPQIFHFLHLTKETLNIPHLSMYEMERMLLIPRASKQLANIMTSLLSSPITKAKLRKIPPMPYEFWTNILAHKIKSWFKVYEGKHRDAVKVLETIGVEPEFWNVFPNAPLLDGKDFEELNFKQRVWLLKTVCDTVMHTRKTVQEEMTKQPWEDQFETVLGMDRYGARYIYFPQFIKSDLRIYKHCLDNKILSTVKPKKPKPKKNLQNHAKIVMARKKLKCRKGKPWWRNGLLMKKTKGVNNREDKSPSDCKCSSDSATGSLTNEDTNLSSTSTCSNNNHISLDMVGRKRSRSLSKTSDVSTTSKASACMSTRSSGYDTNSSLDTLSDKKASQKMFKGFANSSNGKCNIEIISGILNGLKSEIAEERTTDVTDISLTHSSQVGLESSATRPYVETAESRVGRDESADASVDNLSSSSKTDDEKLNEINGAEGSRLSEKKTFRAGEAEQKISTTSKSDDEKLSETRTTGNCTKESDILVPQSRNLDQWFDTATEVEERDDQEVEKNGRLGEGKSEDHVSDETNAVEKRDDKPRRGMQTRYRTRNSNKAEKEASSRSEKFQPRESAENDDAESSDDKDMSLGDLRTLLQREVMDDDFSYDEQSEIGYNLRKPKDEKTESWRKDIRDFNKMLSELSVSEFQLVADSIESLRELISSFSKKDDGSNTSSNNESENIPVCEVRLLKKLTELLKSIEQMEPSLRESMRKARGKMQKEWTNFKEGSVEDQDSSGEGGLSSNWWVLGSQGCPLPTPGDATLQTLSQPALSPAGAKSHADKSQERPELPARSAEQVVERRQQERRERQDESAESEMRSRSENEEEERSQEGHYEKSENESKEEEQQSRRVLRARGISSYTEQFYSDDEIEENELEEWTDVEAVYAAPSAQTGTSAPHTSPKVRHPDDWTDEEDSDQDWILPSSRKRRSKRPSANRRLKSFQHKLQSIKVDGLQDTVDPSPPNSSPAKVTNKDRPKIKETKVCRTKNASTPHAPSSNDTENHETAVEGDPNRTAFPTETVCKVEPVDSVHSELDIKDEGPIFDTVPNQFDSTYGSLPQNYVMVKTNHNPMNYYVMQPGSASVVQPSAIMQPGPVISGIIPPIQQGYYVQGGQNYIIHNPQPSFVSTQQTNFQPQGPQIMAPQQFISHPGYVPCMVSTTQPQPSFIATQEVRPNTLLTSHGVRPPARYVHNRYPVPRQNFPHPSGAVIRSSVPVREICPRPSNMKSAKTLVQSRLTKVQRARKRSVNTEGTGQKTTSLIVLSDSDDEIEMIIPEKTGSEVDDGRTRSMERKDANQKEGPTVTSEIAVATPRGTIPPQIIQRMSQGGISITPVKSAAPVQNPNTQLVVVVNETGSHYALALPNGSKLILTPGQVAQIRASNGGKLIL